MDKAVDRKTYIMLQAVVILVGLVFTALFIIDVWIRHRFDLQKILGYILYFGAADMLTFFSEKINLKDYVIPLVLLALAAILIVI